MDARSPQPPAFLVTTKAPGHPARRGVLSVGVVLALLAATSAAARPWIAHPDPAPAPSTPAAAPTAESQPLVTLPTTVSTAAPEPEGCHFQAGFAELRRQVGSEIVGDCVEDEHATAGGDVLQLTVNGVLVWRKADNAAAFSDGQHTWILHADRIWKRHNGERLAWELPAAGPILPTHRILTYYGNPLSSAMGVLGEPPLETMLSRLRDEVANYATVEPQRPVVAALELVAIVAQDRPGPGNLYRLRMEPEVIEEVARWAEQHGYLLFLDIQPGHSPLDAEVQALLPYLERPYVHLALDPEFTMRRGDRPGAAIGTIDAAAVNGVIRTLSDLVERDGLPPKILVVHRFTEPMLTNYRAIKPSPRVQVVVTMDGFGAPDAKRSKYESLVRDQPVQFAGFKLFYRQDAPPMRPREVLELDPRPDLVIYQ